MKPRLFTPGPTPVPEDVLLRMAQPPMHHRSPEFRALAARVRANLQYLFQTSQPVLILTSSGTGGMEAAVVNLFSPGDTVLAVNGGKFGERWVQLPRTYGMRVIELAVPWGTAVPAEEIRSALQGHPEIRGVLLTHSETSTGAAIDLRAVAATIHAQGNALIVVDGITSVGAHELRFDDWGIDACVTCSQKGLMIPPGLAFVALSHRALEAMEHSTTPRFYFDLRRAMAAADSGDTPWTPAISLMSALEAALDRIRAEGIDQIWNRHRRIAMAVRAGVRALGLRLFSEAPSFAVTPVWVPDGIPWADLNRALKTDNGVTVAGGQGDFAGKIFRIAHLGYVDELDAVAVVAALERSLGVCGHSVTPGAGVAAVQGSFAADSKFPPPVSTKM